MNQGPIHNFLNNHFSNEVFVPYLNDEELRFIAQTFPYVKKFEFGDLNRQFFSHQIENSIEMHFSIIKKDLATLQFRYIYKSQFGWNQEIPRLMNDDEIMKYGIPALVECGNDWLQLIRDEKLISPQWMRLFASSQNLKTLSWLDHFENIPSLELSLMIRTIFRLGRMWENHLNKYLEELGRSATVELNMLLKAKTRWLDQGDYTILGFPMKYPWDLLIKTLNKKSLLMDDLKWVFEKCQDLDGLAKTRFPRLLAEKSEHLNMLADYALMEDVPESIKEILSDRIFL